jgi:hypothetical protein
MFSGGRRKSWQRLSADHNLWTDAIDTVQGYDFDLSFAAF